MKMTNVMQKVVTGLCLLVPIFFQSQAARAANFTAGNLALFLAADNTANNTTFSIVEINTTSASQSAVQTVAINGTTGADALRTSGSGTSTGYLADSDDGTLLIFAAHNSTSTGVNANTLTARAAATLNNAAVFTKTATYTGASGNQVRGATTINNSHFYVGEQGGVYTNGTSAAVSSGNFRAVKPFGGVLYMLQQSSTVANIVVSTVSADAKTVSGLTGLANDSTANDFYLVSSGSNGSAYDVLYVLTTAGIKKYSLVSGTWTANGTYATVTGFGLCAAKSGSGAVLYVTTGGGATAANSVVKVTDTAGYNSAITVTTANNVTLFTATSPATVKGIAFAPKAATTVPTVTSSAATGVSGSAATLNGNVTADGGATIVDRGFVFKTSAGVTMADNKTSVPGTTGAFSTNLASLSPGQTYYFKAYASNSVGVALSSELNFTTPGGTPPSLTAATGATVDNPFSVTFVDDATWRGLITGINVGGTSLSASAYSVSAGQITFSPSASVLLQTNGTKNITVQATGYSDATVSQSLSYGAATKLALVSQPAAPATNGGALGTQPLVAVQDQYGNTVTNSSASVTAAAVQGTWSLGGTLSVNASSGVAAFSGLTASASAAVTGATIDFTSSSLTHVTSASFNIPAPAPPALTAAVGATVDNPFTVTFTDNSSWRSAITTITVGGTTISNAAYSINAGQITFTPAASVLLQTNGIKSIVVIASGFANNNVSQPLGFGAASKLGITTQPTAPAINGNALGAQPVVVIQDQYGNLVTNSSASVAAAAVQGTWSLGGTLSVNASSGVAAFSGLTASASAAVSGATIDFTSSSLTHVTSASFNISAPAPALAEVFVPQFIQGGLSNNGKRVPYAYRVTLYNLNPNTTYNYINSVVIGSDSATSAGAGNAVYVTASGAFVRSGGPSLASAGNFGTFTTDANGTYTGWFITEPTGNSTRFATAGTQVYQRIILNDGAGGTANTTFLTTTNFATVTAFSTTGANSGTAIRGTSLAAAKNFVMLYDNAAGTGRPVAGTVIEDDGSTAVVSSSSGYAAFYTNSVDGVNGSWGCLIPNNLANGIRRIENRAKTDGSLVFANIDSDGAWPSGANTVNPSGGDATPLLINASDAPLAISNPAFTLNSSANPAGYLDNLVFTGSLPANATGNVIFYAGLAPFSTNAVSSGSAASTSLNTLPRGTTTITAVYVGDGNYFSVTNSINQTVTNHPPIAVADAFTRSAGVNTLRISIADLFTNDTDVDGDMLSLVSVSQSSNSITLYTNSTFILYTNPANVADQFTYTVKDSFGDTATGTVSISIGQAGTGQIQGFMFSGGTATLQFAGIPGYNYSVERTTNLINWDTIFTTNAPAALWQVTDDLGPNPPSQAYYRLRYNP